MGPSTSSPSFLLLLMSSSVIGGGLLLWTDYRVSGLLTLGAGLVVFLLHLACVRSARERVGKENRAIPLTGEQKRNMAELREKTK